MRAIVGDEQVGSEGGPTVEAAVHDFDARQDAGERVGDLIAIQRLRGGRQIAREAESIFRFDDAHEKIAGGEKRGAIESQSRKQAAIERLSYAEEALCD